MKIHAVMYPEALDHGISKDCEEPSAQIRRRRVSPFSRNEISRCGYDLFERNMGCIPPVVLPLGARRVCARPNAASNKSYLAIQKIELFHDGFFKRPPHCLALGAFPLFRKLLNSLYRVAIDTVINDGISSDCNWSSTSVLFGLSHFLSPRLSFGTSGAFLRSFLKGTEVWFVAKDVCDVLGIANSRDAVSRLDDDEKGVATADTLGGSQGLATINESGLYALILTSRKPEAKRFRKWITSDVIPKIRQTGSYSLPGQAKGIPSFVRRFNANWNRVDRSYFSVIGEVFIRLYGRLEQVGYVIPDIGATGKEIRPDISVGRHFATWLNENHPLHKDSHKNYSHALPNGKFVDARQYPNDLLPLFIRFMEEEYIPKHAEGYLRQRDMKALEYFPKLLPPPSGGLK